MDLVLRVAARALRAGFIPDKFFKAKAAELKKLLLTPTGAPDMVAFEINDRVLPFYKKFEQELLEFGMHRFAEQSVRERIKAMVDIVEKLSSAHSGFHRATYTLPPQGPKAEVLSSLQTEIRSAYGEKFPRLANAFKATWFVDENQIATLADKVLRKASSTELQALERVAEGDFSSSPLGMKYEFLRRVGATAAALRLVKKEKVTWDPFRSMQMLRDVLEANYSDRADVQATEFDLFGMKIVVNDASVSQEQIKDYVKYLKEAHARLKTKGFGKVWYGTTLIDCSECGGVNQNTGDHDVGGHYNIQKDWVKIFVRPDPSIVELMAHELGHRHWYKGMTSEQRARFHGLVRTHEGRNPEKLKARRIPLATMAERRNRVFRVCDQILVNLHALDSESRQRPLTKDDLPSWKGAFRNDDNLLSDLYSVASNMVEKGGDLHQTPEVLRLGTEYSELLMEVQGDLVDKLSAAFQSDDVTRAVESYVGYFEARVKKLRDLGGEYLLRLTRSHNEIATEEAEKAIQEAKEKWEVDERQVLPVSDYGGSNISEAFAEVFMKYVMDDNMNRDQLESFKSVFASMKTMADLAPEEHYVQVCRGCGVKMGSCRCSGERTTVYGICPRCSS